MEMKIVELNDTTMELINLMSEGKLTLEAVNIITGALNKGDIQATYQTNKKELYQDGTGAFRTIELDEMVTKSYIEDLANDFNSIMITYGEKEAEKHLSNLVKPVKKTYRKYRRY